MTRTPPNRARAALRPIVLGYLGGRSPPALPGSWTPDRKADPVARRSEPTEPHRRTDTPDALA